jgi:hypothetical protein
MSELLIYLNERCFPVCCSDDAALSEGLKTMIATFEKAMERNGGAKIGVLRQHWHGSDGQRSLSEQIRKALSSEKTRYQRFLKKIQFVTSYQFDGAHEIHYENSTAIGLGLADLDASKWRHGWALSYGRDEEKWRKTLLPAERYLLDSSGAITGPTHCEICNLAEPDHVETWDQQLRDWGEVVAPSCVLDHMKGHPIVMYPGPLEHNPPHVHLRRSANHSGDIAKYRILDGIRETGLPTLDCEMKAWITIHRDHLLKSWERCQRGGHPYQLR